MLIDKDILFSHVSDSEYKVSAWPWTEETNPSIYEGRTDWPKISIITPSFNQGQFIEETIRSVLLQNYPNLEYIIIDGGSTDNTIEIIKKYGKYISYWVSEKDRGQSEAINKGLRKASGEIIAWLNSDDWYEPDCLYEISRLFFEKSVYIVNGNCRFLYENLPEKNYTLEYGVVDEDRLLTYWTEIHDANPPQPSVFIRKAVLDKVGYLDESLHYGMDHDLWLRLVSLYHFTYVNKILSNYRFHEDSKSFSGNGFEKFYPEWHHNFLTAIKQFSFMKRLKYHLKYFIHRMDITIPHFKSVRNRFFFRWGI